MDPFLGFDRLLKFIYSLVSSKIPTYSVSIIVHIRFIVLYFLFGLLFHFTNIYMYMFGKNNLKLKKQIFIDISRIIHIAST